MFRTVLYSNANSLVYLNLTFPYTHNTKYIIYYYMHKKEIVKQSLSFSKMSQQSNRSHTFPCLLKKNNLDFLLCKSCPIYLYFNEWITAVQTLYDDCDLIVVYCQNVEIKFYSAMLHVLLFCPIVILIVYILWWKFLNVISIALNP